MYIPYMYIKPTWNYKEEKKRPGKEWNNETNAFSAKKSRQIQPGWGEMQRTDSSCHNQMPAMELLRQREEKTKKSLWNKKLIVLQ